jgi:hypothetical protein
VAVKVIVADRESVDVLAVVLVKVTVVVPVGPVVRDALAQAGTPDKDQPSSTLVVAVGVAVEPVVAATVPTVGVTSRVGVGVGVAPSWVNVYVTEGAPVAANVMVADREVVAVLAVVVVNVTGVVPVGPVVGDALAQVGRPDRVQPSSTFVATTGVTVEPTQAATVPLVGVTVSVGVAPSWVSV